MPTRPNTLEVLTMTPSSCSTRMGRKARVPLTTPPKLTWRSHSSSSGSASSTDEATATPALLNTARGARQRGQPLAHLGREAALVRGVPHVERPDQHGPRQRPRGLLKAGLVDVGDGRRRA